MSADAPSYSDRIARRRRIWWGKPRNLRDPRAYSHFLHQIHERNTFRHRFDPDERWRCCVHWQRSLSNKWNAREFALRNGCRVPELYWDGRGVRKLCFDALPDRYVIRQTFGHSRKRVYVFCGVREVASGRRVSKNEIRGNLGGAVRSLVRGRILVEEFVGRWPGSCEMPLECRLFMFGHRVGAIEVFRRSHIRLAPASYVEGLGLSEHRFYTAAWEPFEEPVFGAEVLRRFYGYVAPTDPYSAPEYLSEVTDAARRLGVAYGAHVRVDFLVGQSGVFFNEFSTTPGGRFTSFANEYLGGLWQEVFPDKI